MVTNDREQAEGRKDLTECMADCPVLRPILAIYTKLEKDHAWFI